MDDLDAWPWPYWTCAFWALAQYLLCKTSAFFYRSYLGSWPFLRCKYILIVAYMTAIYGYIMFSVILRIYRVSHTVFDTLRHFLSLHFTWTGETYHTWLCVGPPGKLRHTTKDVHRWALYQAQPSWIVFTKTRQLSTPYDSFRHPLILACWGSDLSHFALFSWYLTCDGIKYVLN